MSIRALGNQFHGTTEHLRVGQEIRGPSHTGVRSGWESDGIDSSHEHGYATGSASEAVNWAIQRSGHEADMDEYGDDYHEAKPRVYAVEPVDHDDVEYDPNYEVPHEGSDEALNTRSKRGYRVVGDVTGAAMDERYG